MRTPPNERSCCPHLVSIAASQQMPAVRGDILSKGSGGCLGERGRLQSDRLYRLTRLNKEPSETSTNVDPYRINPVLVLNDGAGTSFTFHKVALNHTQSNTSSALYKCYRHITAMYQAAFLDGSENFPELRHSQSYL